MDTHILRGQFRHEAYSDYEQRNLVASAVIPQEGRRDCAELNFSKTEFARVGRQRGGRRKRTPPSSWAQIRGILKYTYEIRRRFKKIAGRSSWNNFEMKDGLSQIQIVS